MGAWSPAIQFIPALEGFLGYDPEPVDTGTVAGRLVSMQRELGLSQLQAARLIGVDPATWAGWEEGNARAGAGKEEGEGGSGRAGHCFTNAPL